MSAILLTTDNKVQKVEVDFKDFKNIYPAMNLKSDGSDLFEHVMPRRLYTTLGMPRTVSMLVDEEGILKGKPVNGVASWLYAADKHGSFIVGDALFVGESASDFCDIPDELFEKLYTQLELLTAITAGK